ncbi:FadR/GntR family transcriptional regulator [Neobacillus sp. Marseille-QA0830]
MFAEPKFQFETVSPKKVSDFIFDQLEEAIILKELLSGEQLPTERELATIFKTSRLAIREALSILEERGLIEKRVGAKGGTFVLPLTINSHMRNRLEIRKQWDEMTKVFEFRSIIEPEAAYLAAERISEQELNRLRDYLNQSIEPDCTRELFRSLDVKFHLTVAKASGNSYFEKAVRLIRTKINPALDLVPYNDRVKTVNYEGHVKLLEALEQRDGEQSREIMRLHISSSEKSIFSKVFTSEKDE